MSSKCTNYCVNGSCSNCGNCCTELIPLTKDEVSLIKAYVKEKQIKPYSDIFFKLGDKWMIAKSVGWNKVDSYEEAVDIVIKQQF